MTPRAFDKGERRLYKDVREFDKRTRFTEEHADFASFSGSDFDSFSGSECGRCEDQLL